MARKLRTPTHSKKYKADPTQHFPRKILGFPVHSLPPFFPKEIFSSFQNCITIGESGKRTFDKGWGYTEGWVSSQISLFSKQVVQVWSLFFLDDIDFFFCLPSSPWTVEVLLFTSFRLKILPRENLACFSQPPFRHGAFVTVRVSQKTAIKAVPVDNSAQKEKLPKVFLRPGRTSPHPACSVLILNKKIPIRYKSDSARLKLFFSVVRRRQKKKVSTTLL